MRYNVLCLLGLGLLGGTCMSAGAQPHEFPEWAYPPCVRTADAEPLDMAAQLSAAAGNSNKAACTYCHLPDGSGRPENAKPRTVLTKERVVCGSVGTRVRAGTHSRLRSLCSGRGAPCAPEAHHCRNADRGSELRGARWSPI